MIGEMHGVEGVEKEHSRFSIQRGVICAATREQGVNDIFWEATSGFVEVIMVE